VAPLKLVEGPARRRACSRSSERGGCADAVRSVPCAAMTGTAPSTAAAFAAACPFIIAIAT
jgi:hypothetical protein